MTEAEWLDSTDPIAMLEFVGDRISHRKLWLFGCACCRRIWPLLPQVSKEAVEVGESYADGLAPHALLMDASSKNYQESSASAVELTIQASVAANMAVVDPSRNGYPALTVSQAARRTAEKVVLVLGLARPESGQGAEVEGEPRAQVRLLRDIVGNPFRPACLKSECRSPTVFDEARAIYADRAFDRLPSLADALEDAGCYDADVLTHCRSEGPHIRGCWAIDLALGRE